jgi:uncharacterized membrane protein
MRQAIKLTLFCLALSSPLFAADYRFVRIDFPNAIATTAGSINARGDISGLYFDANDVGHGFLLSKGVFITIDFPQASFTSARAMNARGDIAGRIHDANGNDHGFLLHDGLFTRIDYPGAAATVARGINNAGDVTGNHVDSVGTESGFILKNGTFYNVRVPHSLGTDVWMAEDNGRVMVGDTAFPSDGGALHGYIRNQRGDFQLIDFPGLSVPCTGPRWINERGEIVGLFATVSTVDECFNSPTHGFVLRQGKYVAIDFPGSTSTSALGINDDGVIVGDYSDQQGVAHGFKAVPKGEQ